MLQAISYFSLYLYCFSPVVHWISEGNVALFTELHLSYSWLQVPLQIQITNTNYWLKSTNKLCNIIAEVKMPPTYKIIKISPTFTWCNISDEHICLINYYMVWIILKMGNVYNAFGTFLTDHNRFQRDRVFNIMMTIKTKYITLKFLNMRLLMISWPSATLLYWLTPHPKEITLTPPTLLTDSWSQGSE